MTPLTTLLQKLHAASSSLLFFSKTSGQRSRGDAWLAQLSPLQFHPHLPSVSCPVSGICSSTPDPPHGRRPASRSISETPDRADGGGTGPSLTPGNSTHHNSSCDFPRRRELRWPRHKFVYFPFKPTIRFYALHRNKYGFTEKREEWLEPNCRSVDHLLQLLGWQRGGQQRSKRGVDREQEDF